MVQRKIVPCCLPPASWDSDVPAWCFAWCLMLITLMYLWYLLPCAPFCLWPCTPTTFQPLFSFKSELSTTSPSSAPPCLLMRLRLLCFFFEFSYFWLCHVFWEESLHTHGKDMAFLPHGSCFSSLNTTEPPVPPASCWPHQLSLPQLCPKGSSVSGHEGLSGTLEHHLHMLFRLWTTSTSPPMCHYTTTIMLLIKSFVVINLTLSSTTTPAALKENVI